MVTAVTNRGGSKGGARECPGPLARQKLLNPDFFGSAEVHFWCYFFNLILNFISKSISNTKVSRGAKIVSNLGFKCKFNIFT